jgi:indole-3-glycerol phosphate synthase
MRRTGTQRDRLLAEKREEVERLRNQRVTEITPSVRDFLQWVTTHKQSIALVPRLKRSDPDTQGDWSKLDLVQLAQQYDEADAPALAVCTARRYGGSVEDLRFVSNAVTAPIVRDDLCLDPSQVYQARLHGADAVVVPASHLAPQDVTDLVRIASSLHMASVIEVASEEEISVAADIPNASVGLRCPDDSGFVDLDEVRALAARLPRQRTILLLTEVSSLDDLRSLIAVIDAAVVGNALLDADDPAALLRAWA